MGHVPPPPRPPPPRPPRRAADDPADSTPDGVPDAGPAAGPRLVAMALPQDDPLPALEAAWRAGKAVLPLPSDDGDAVRLVEALGPDEVLGHPPGWRPSGSDSSGSEHPPPGLPPDAALVVATSGSTGAPRGVVLTHGALAAAVAASLGHLDAHAEDRWLCCLPTTHVAGLLVLLRARAGGRPALVHGRFDVARVASALAAPDPPTLVSLVPTMLHRLLEGDVDVARFRRILLGGAAADPALLARARSRGARIVLTYGMSETCGGVVYDGAPLPGVGAAVDTDGRILLSGPMLAAGYRDGTPLPRRDGWFVTADHGAWGADGRLQVRGRVDDVVVTGGENVDLGGVRRALEADPAVTAAAVAGIEDPVWGRRIEAWIVTSDSLPDVAARARRRLPRAAVPKRLHRVAALPTTGLGKVARGALSGTDVLESHSPARPSCPDHPAG